MILLIGALPAHKAAPETLLRSAASLWATNILVFALWHWRLDAGGPRQRDKRARHSNRAFLFPRMIMSERALREAGQQGWSPNFIDYLFLAFNTSAAFLADRYAGALAVGERLDDVAVAALTADYCAVGRTRREYSVIAGDG